MPQTSVLDHAYELLVEYFVISSHSIAFPELVLPTIVEVGGVGSMGWVGSNGMAVVQWDGCGPCDIIIHVLQLNKVAKETHFSWFKRQIKQLVAKVGVILCVSGCDPFCEWV